MQDLISRKLSQLISTRPKIIPNVLFLFKKIVVMLIQMLTLCAHCCGKYSCNGTVNIVKYHSFSAWFCWFYICAVKCNNTDYNMWSLVLFVYYYRWSTKVELKHEWFAIITWNGRQLHSGNYWLTDRDALYFGFYICYRDILADPNCKHCLYETIILE